MPDDIRPRQPNLDRECGVSTRGEALMRRRLKEVRAPAAEGPGPTEHPVSDPKLSLGYALRDINRWYTRLFEARARAFGLTLMQCRALILIAQNQGVTQTQLAQLIEADAMALVRIIDRMEAQGWVRRTKAPEDRRTRRLSVTAAGLPLLEQIQFVIAQTRRQAFNEFSADECAQFMDLLQRMHANLAQFSICTRGSRQIIELPLLRRQSTW